MNKDKSKQWYYGCLCAYLLVTGYAIYDAFSKGYSQSLTMGFVSLSLVVIVPLVFKLFKWKPIYEVYTLSLLFMFLSSTLGSAFRFYNNVPYWDKFVHGLSGFLGILVGYFLYGLLKKCIKAKEKDVPLLLIFINAINISIAALWEVYEYAGLVLFDYDSILHYKTGVHDSMTDIIVCVVGGILGTYFIYCYYKNGKPNFLTNIYEKFYLLNGKGKNLIVRKYHSDDCETILRLFDDTVRTINAKDYTPEQIEAWTHNQNAETWDEILSQHMTLVAIIDNQIVGFVDMDESGYLDHVYVHKDYQGCHVASTLCDTIESMHSKNVIVTHASISAKGFFEQRGYIVSYKQEVKKGKELLTNFVMEKRMVE